MCMCWRICAPYSTIILLHCNTPLYSLLCIVCRCVCMYVCEYNTCCLFAAINVCLCIWTLYPSMRICILCFLFSLFSFVLFFCSIYCKYTMTLFRNHMLAFHIIAEIKFDDFMWTNLRKHKNSHNDTFWLFALLFRFFIFVQSSSSICSSCFLPLISWTVTHCMRIYRH